MFITNIELEIIINVVNNFFEEDLGEEIRQLIQESKNPLPGN